MSSRNPSERSDAETVLLEARYECTIELERAADALADLDWLGRVVLGAAPDGARQVTTDLELPIRDGSSPGPVRKSAILDIGEPRRSGEAVVAAIGWRSATLAPLFPVFSGRLTVRRTGLELVGRYAPPLGRLGLLLDATLLHVVARRTADALLSRFAARISSPRG